jgi:hypothetical protein
LPPGFADGLNAPQRAPVFAGNGHRLNAPPPPVNMEAKEVKEENPDPMVPRLPPLNRPPRNPAQPDGADLNPMMMFQPPAPRPDQFHNMRVAASRSKNSQMQDKYGTSTSSH